MKPGRTYVLWAGDRLCLTTGDVLLVQHVGPEEIVLHNGDEARGFDRALWEELRPGLQLVVRGNQWMDASEMQWEVP